MKSRNNKTFNSVFMSDSANLTQRKKELEKRLEALGAKAIKKPQIRQRQNNYNDNVYAYLLIDCSGSMSGDKLSQAKTGSLGFAEKAFIKGYSVGLISFSTEVKILSEPIDDISKLKIRINQLRSSGTTNMTGAIQLTKEKFPSPLGSGTLVIVTDGIPNNADSALKAAEIIKKLGIEIITIGTDDANQHFLEQIASKKELSIPISQEKLASGITDAAKLLSGKDKF